MNALSHCLSSLMSCDSAARSVCPRVLARLLAPTATLAASSARSHPASISSAFMRRSRSCSRRTSMLKGTLKDENHCPGSGEGGSGPGGEPNAGRLCCATRPRAHATPRARRRLVALSALSPSLDAALPRWKTGGRGCTGRAGRRRAPAACPRDRARSHPARAEQLRRKPERVVLEPSVARGDERQARHS
jgi:hypothetical protein